jgi:glutamate carboxypeptidase
MTGLADREVRRIVNYLQQQRAGMVELLQRLVLTESSSEDPTGLDQVLVILAAEFKSSGMSVRCLPGRASGGLVYARQPQRPARDPFQLLIGHCDRVWPPWTLDTMPMRSENGTITGPGVFDMKVGLVQMIYAPLSLHELNMPARVL